MLGPGAPPRRTFRHLLQSMSAILRQNFFAISTHALPPCSLRLRSRQRPIDGAEAIDA